MRPFPWLIAAWGFTPLLQPDAAANRGRTAGSQPKAPFAACDKLVSDTLPRRDTGLAMPGYLQSAIDPAFGTTIVRVTGSPGDTIPNVGGRAGTWRSVGGPTYAKTPSWNADQSMIVSTTSAPGYLFIDGSDYHVVGYRAGVPGDTSSGEARWDPVNRDLMIYVRANGEAGFWNPMADTTSERTGAVKGLHRCGLGPWEGNSSNDGRRIVLSCLKDDVNGDSAFVFFAVDLATRTKYPMIRPVELGFSGATTSSHEPLDWASISAFGDYIVASQDWRQNRALALDGTIVSSWTEMGHYDLGTDATGAEVAFSGSGYMVTLASGAATQLVSTRARAYHSSTRNQVGAPGWGFASLEDSATSAMRGEIVAMELKAHGGVRRLVHHRATSRAYDRDAFGSPSPDGQRVFYRSVWGDAHGPVYGFVVDTRQLCHGERALSIQR